MRTRPDQDVPSDITAVVFGVDGVIVDSDQASAAAWKSVFDPFLRTYAAVHELPFIPFDVHNDYLRYADGKGHMDAARDFLSSRDVCLPYDDLRGLAARHEEFFLAEVRRNGIAPFVSVVTVLRGIRRHGVRTAAVSAQTYGAEMLRRAGVPDLFDMRLDGLDARGTGLPGHPDPALYLQAALRLGTPPRHTAVVEASLVGVMAARRGGFGLVIGVDHRGDAAAYRGHGADTVITDLSELRLRRRHAA